VSLLYTQAATCLRLGHHAEAVAILHAPATVVFVVGKQLSDAKVRTDGATLATNVDAIGATPAAASSPLIATAVWFDLAPGTAVGSDCLEVAEHDLGEARRRVAVRARRFVGFAAVVAVTLPRGRR
jgi:hypothetical protein